MLVAMGRLVRNEAGVTAIEYALIAALVALAVVAGGASLGEQLAPVFEELSAAI